MTKTKILIISITGIVLVSFILITSLIIYDRKNLSEKEARVALDELLTNWCFGNLEDTDTISINFQPSTGYTPEKYEILNGHKYSETGWEFKTDIRFSTKNGFSKPYILEFTTSLHKDGKVYVTCFQDPGSMDTLNSLSELIKLKKEYAESIIEGQHR